MHKVCVKCSESLPEEAFNFKFKKKGIRQSYCRECHKKYLKQHYHENKAYYVEKARGHTKRYQEEARKAIFEFKLGNPCAACGIDDPRVLEFNHVDPKNKKHNVAEMVKSGHSVKSILKEVAKCEVLCANCHRIKTAKDFEYYSYKQIGE